MQAEVFRVRIPKGWKCVDLSGGLVIMGGTLDVLLTRHGPGLDGDIALRAHCPSSFDPGKNAPAL